MCWKKKATLKCGCTVDRRKIPGLPSDQDHDAAMDVVLDECKKSSCPKIFF